MLVKPCARQVYPHRAWRSRLRARAMTPFCILATTANVTPPVVVRFPVAGASLESQKAGPPHRTRGGNHLLVRPGGSPAISRPVRQTARKAATRRANSAHVAPGGAGRDECCPRVATGDKS
jgi:hypothetical protein